KSTLLDCLSLAMRQPRVVSTATARDTASLTITPALPRASDTGRTKPCAHENACEGREASPRQPPQNQKDNQATADKCDPKPAEPASIFYPTPSQQSPCCHALRSHQRRHTPPAACQPPQAMHSRQHRHPSVRAQ